MPVATRRNRKNGGGWSQGPPLSSEQYYLTEYKNYSECYPMARPGTIQSPGLNPNLAQTGMAGGARRQRSRRSTKRNNRQRGGNSCAEYFSTRGGASGANISVQARLNAAPRGLGGKRNSRSSRKSRKMGGGCGCMLQNGGATCPFMRGGATCPFMRGGGCGCMLRGGAIYGECPYKANSFNCPYAQGGKRNDRKQKKNKTRKNLKGGRYGIDPGVSVGGDGPNVAALTAHVPCEAYRPMSINPHLPNELVSAPETGIHFAGLSPGAVLKGGARRKNKKSKNLRSSLKGGEVNLVHTKFAAYTGAPISERAPNMQTNVPHTHTAPKLQIAEAQMYTGAPLTAKYPPLVQTGGQLRGDEHPLAYTAPRAGFAFFPNISQGQTLNPGQIPYNVVVPVDGSDSASCGLTCGQAIAQINKP